MPDTALDSAEAERHRRSDAIRLARVICITGVVYVHAWTGLDGNQLHLAHGSAQETLRWVLMEVFGRSSVPLLGLISGWLVAGSSRTRDWRAHIGRKARTILLPMVLWNALAIVLVSGAAWQLGLKAPQPQSAGWVVEELFALTRPPDIDVQMPFLRDLFLCMMVAPLLVRLPGKALALVALAAGLCHVADIGPPVILRASIAMFFTLGILARRAGAAERTAHWPLGFALLPFAILMPVHLAMTLQTVGPPTGPLAAALDLAVRVAASLAVWRLSWALVPSRIAVPLLRVEPFVFFFFCAHLIILWLGGPVLGRLTGPLGSPLYPLYLLAQPFIVLGVAVLVARALLRIAPGFAGILSGGRLKPA